MGSALSLRLPAAPPATSKATQTDWNCPVCRSVEGDTAAVPCGHRFCLGCLLRHTAGSATCPQCASPVLSARFAVLGRNDFLQCLLSQAAARPGPAGWARPARFRLVYTGPGAPRAALTPAEPEAEEQFPEELWAELLHGQERLLEPVRPWLRRSLDTIYGPHWWEARQVETIALATLCVCGPDRAELTHMLQRYLGDYTAPLIRGLIHVAVRGCREAWLQRRSPPAPQDEPDEAQSPAAGAGPSSPGGTPGLAPDHAGPGRPERGAEPGLPPAAPGPAEQERPRGGSEQRQAPAGPQEDALAPGPSAPRRSRNRRPPARVTRRSEGRRAHKSRRPLSVRRRKLRRK